MDKQWRIVWLYLPLQTRRIRQGRRSGQGGQTSALRRQFVKGFGQLITRHSMMRLESELRRVKKVPFDPFQLSFHMPCLVATQLCWPVFHIEGKFKLKVFSCICSPSLIPSPSPTHSLCHTSCMHLCKCVCIEVPFESLTCSSHATISQGQCGQIGFGTLV